MRTFNEYEDTLATTEEREPVRLTQEILDVLLYQEPPKYLTPRMAQAALWQLIQLDRQLGKETMSVMMGIRQLNTALQREAKRLSHYRSSCAGK
jgi:hypothetical protein